jgi:hypothetical protein
MNQIKRDHVIPLPDQKMLKLNGILRANSPALAASGTFGHVVFKRAPVILIIKIQCRCRTIFHTGQTPVTVLIYSKIRH